MRTRPMSSSFIWLLAALALAGPARADVVLVMSAGGDEHAWVVLKDVEIRGEPDAARPGDDDPTDAERIRLLHVPGAMPHGSIRPTPIALPAAPLAMAASGDRLLLAMPSLGGADGVAPMRVVRVESAAPPRFVYNGPAPLPPITATGDIVSVGFIAGDPSAVVHEQREGSNRLALLRLTDDGWTEFAPPAFLNHGADVRLRAAGGAEAVLLEHGPTVGARLWRAPIHADDADPPDAPDWRDMQIDTSERSFLDAVLCGRQVAALFEATPGEAVAAIAAGDGVREFGRLPWTRASTVLALDRRLMSFGFEGPSGTRVSAKVLALDGAVLFDGPARIVGPVAPGEVQALAVVLGSIFLSTVVFVLRPASSWGAVVALPEGAALAEPTRRIAAFSVDLLPGLVVSWAVWGGGATLADAGAWPLLTIAGVTIAHSALAEAVTGRTLGKAITGCRTVTVRGGERPSPTQALLHSTIKVLCPPLALFTLINPFAPGPASFGTVVVVDVPNGDAGDAA